MSLLATGLFALMSTTPLAAGAAQSPADAANATVSHVSAAAQGHGALAQSGISSQALSLATKDYNAARAKGETKSDVMTIVDFSKPSNEKRLYVVNMSTNQVLYNGFTSQGKGSGTGLMATKFSDSANSKESSLGLYKTAASTFQGKHGTSLKLIGLDSTNKYAASRAIEMHPAPYASKQFVAKNGRTGNSWGCFALDPSDSKAVFSKVSGGSLLLAYAPQLSHEA